MTKTTVASKQFRDLSGSLTRLLTGEPYLIAGAGVVISTGSNGQVTIGSYGGGGGVIGPAEDGSYADGLYTDFIDTTPVGTAVDRFNEVLKFLVPTPPPNVSRINADASGVTALLSFGASLPLSGYTNVNSGGFSAVDYNGSYGVAENGGSFRRGVFPSGQVFNGDINPFTSASLYGIVVNYTNRAFLAAESGSLQLYNNGVLLHTVSLYGFGTGAPTLGTATSTNANGSGFLQVSTTASCKMSTGVEFTPFQYRTTAFRVAAADQVDGWNNVQVKHVYGGSTYVTNYVEWVRDSNTTPLTSSGNVTGLNLGGLRYLSGIKYFVSGYAYYTGSISNFYRNVYAQNNVTFVCSTATFPPTTVPTLGPTESVAKVIQLPNTGTITALEMYSGSVAVGVSVSHPLKAALVNDNPASAGGVLLYNLPDTSTDISETFQSESYRITSASYDTQSSVVSASWNHMLFVTASAGHDDGLVFFSKNLRSPTNTVVGGDMRSVADGGSMTWAPAGNPNYSGISGIRTFYRRFKNTSGVPVRNVGLTISGSSNLVSHSASLGPSDVKVFVKVPEVTGWMDAATSFVWNNVADNSGSVYGTVDTALPSLNKITIGDAVIPTGSYVVLKVVASSSWTGNISGITANFTNGTPSVTSAPNLSSASIDQSGLTARLSFGATKPITGVTSVAGVGNLSSVDVNSVMAPASFRGGVFSSYQTGSGDLNFHVSVSAPSYVAKAFGSANSGSLVLEINGVETHVFDITNVLTGTGAPGAGTATTHSSGSCFTSLSVASPGVSTDGYPDYRYWQRTAKFRVVPSDNVVGWNYARIIHRTPGGDLTTNYVDWVVDTNSSTMTIGSSSLSNFGGTAGYSCSGVKYLTSATASLKCQVANAHKNVTSTLQALQITPLTNVNLTNLILSGPGIVTTSSLLAANYMPYLRAGVTDSQDMPFNLTASLTFNASPSVPENGTSAGAGVSLTHPIKTTATLAALTKTSFLVFNGTETSNMYTLENFTGETYRRVSGSYASQASVSAGAWTSTTSMNDAGSPAYYNGLLIYQGRLKSPKAGPNSGDFRNVEDGGTVQGPYGNPNYSSLGSTENRQYYRYFYNNTTSDTPQAQLTIAGSGVIVARSGPYSGSLGSNNNFHVEVKIPGKTGWLDLARPSDGPGATYDGAGGLVGTLTSGLSVGGVANLLTFNGETENGTTSGAECIVVRITANQNWTGYLSSVQVRHS
jgi:hypothetical protein